MEVLYRVCCGLDVHKKTVAACLRVPGPNTRRSEEIRTFGTTTRELLRLADWLATAGCTHVAMESTGVYWRPVYQILEGNFEVLLVNAQHIKAVSSWTRRSRSSMCASRRTRVRSPQPWSGSTPSRAWPSAVPSKSWPNSVTT